MSVPLGARNRVPGASNAEMLSSANANPLSRALFSAGGGKLVSLSTNSVAVSAAIRQASAST